MSTSSRLAKEARVRVPSRATSRPGRIVCPACGFGELRFRGADLAGCDCCSRDLDKAILRVIEQIVALIEGGSISTRAVDELEAAAEATMEGLPVAGRARYADAYRIAVAYALACARAGSTPELVADAVFRALTEPTPKTRYPVGADARVLLALSEVLSDRLLDRLRFPLFGLQGKFDVRRAEGGGKTQPVHHAAKGR